MLQKQIKEQQELQAAFEHRQAAEEAASKQSEELLAGIGSAIASREFGQSLENMTVSQLLEN